MNQFQSPAAPSRPMPTFQPMAPGSPGYPAPMQPSVNYGFGTFGGSWMPWANNMIGMPAMTGLPVTSMTPPPMDPSLMAPAMQTPMAPPPMPKMPSIPAPAAPVAPTVPNAHQLLDAGSWNIPGFTMHNPMTAPQPTAQGDQGPRPLPPLPWANQPTAMDIYRQMQQQQQGPRQNPMASRFPRIMGMMSRFGR